MGLQETKADDADFPEAEGEALNVYAPGHAGRLHLVGHREGAFHRG